LKCQSRVSPVIRERLLLRLAETAENAAEPNAAAKQASRLACSQIQNVLFAQIHASEARKLQQFPVDHILCEVDQNIQDSEITFLERHLEGLHVKPVAGQHAAMISPARIGGGPPTPRIGAINHIVMDQRGAVNQLDHGAQAHGNASVVARISGGEQQKRGAQALSSPAKQIAGDFGDGLPRKTSLLREFFLYAREVVAYQIKNLFNREQ
jgi:hypothetical protein